MDWGEDRTERGVEKRFGMGVEIGSRMGIEGGEGDRVGNKCGSGGREEMGVEMGWEWDSSGDGERGKGSREEWK